MKFWSLAAVAALLLSACHPKGGEEALAVVKENLAAVVAGDVERVKKTTHPESPTYEATASIVRQTAEMDVASEYEQCRVASVSPNEAVVDFVQVTRAKKPGTSFRDNRVTGAHILHRDGGVWKIWNTRIVRVEYL